MKSRILRMAAVLLCAVTAAYATGAKEGAAAGSAKEPVTLKIWAVISATEAKVIPTYNDCVALQEASKRTGIRMQFIHPAIGQEKEQFNLMIASGDLPDIISSQTGDSFALYKGGVDAAIKDKLLINPGELIDKYALNFKKLFLDDKDYNKMVRSDAGTIIRFGTGIIPREANGAGKAYMGPMIRQDFLEDLGIALPETIAEWQTMLQAFRDKKNVVPLAWGAKGWDVLLGSSSFIGAYDVIKDFYQEDGKIKYGPSEQGFKDFMRLFNQWYAEGLLDKDFATHTYNDNVQPMMMSGKAGATCYHIYHYATYAKNVLKDNPRAKLVAAPFPSLRKGDLQKFRHEYAGFTPLLGKYITTKCKNPIEAVKLIDWIYTPEAIRLMNWGIEGISYTLVGGQPKETQAVTDNRVEMTMKYTSNTFKGVIDMVQAEGQYTLGEQLDAWTKWNKAGTQNNMPLAGLTMSEEESAVNQKVMAEVKTYADEMFFKMIMGVEPVDNFDQDVKKMKDMGLDKALAAQQAALDRYNGRR